MIYVVQTNRLYAYNECVREQQESLSPTPVSTQAHVSESIVRRLLELQKVWCHDHLGSTFQEPACAVGEKPVSKPHPDPPLIQLHAVSSGPVVVNREKINAFPHVCRILVRAIRKL